ncbi:MAG: NAD-dependent succinate-semialdehyde dehydrogenase [Chitinophagales bacterium]|nr:NAD-dependent succinate-semialdehyde dehydrogenase [Chitinophagales bacterium]
MKTFQSINPYDFSIVAEHEIMNELQINSALENATQSFSSWRKTSFQKRSELILSLAKVLRVTKETHTKTIALEMGKILSEGRIEIEKCAKCCDYYAANGEKILTDEPVEADAKKCLVTFQPIGAVFGIMPWNYPFWQVIRAAVPAILAGNVFLLKHAPNVLQCAKELENIFLEAGFPHGVFQNLIIDIDQTEKIILHNIVQGVTITGSELAGSSVASLAGKHIKKSVLELGGSDPLIVLEDADLNEASKIALQSRMQNAGQSCIASKRFIVMEKVKEDFVQKLIEGTKKIKQGNQLLENTSMGPMARLNLAEKLEQQEKSSLKNGTEILIGGTREQSNFQPTLLGNVKPGVPAFDEEMFGPIASIITAKSEAEAIELANRNRYGLGASIWTKDLERGERMAREINAGGVFINSLVKSDPRYPFGGIKKSGYGRELSSYGLKEFTNVKTIFIQE